MPRAVILTALRVEYLAVRGFLYNIKEEIHPQGTIYERGRFTDEEQSWDVGIVEIGEGNSGAALEAERAITYFNPDIILFVGVAGGVKDVVLGDVVASTKVYGYESGKVGQAFKSRSDIGLSAYVLEQRARAEAKKADWLKRLAISDATPRVFVAPIAAGEKIITSTKSEVFQFLRSNYDDVIAVEMEGLGFLEAVRANPQVSAMVIRGISDLIDNKTEVDKTGYQAIAASHASAFAFEILAKMQLKIKAESDKNVELTDSKTIRPSDVTSRSIQQIKIEKPVKIPSIPFKSYFTYKVIEVNSSGLEIGRHQKKSEYYRENLDEKVYLDMVFIPKGDFCYGTLDMSSYNNDNEGSYIPMQSFWMSKYPVTQAQWTLVAKLPKVKCDLLLEPSCFKKEDFPVEQISWLEAVEFCDRISKNTGRRYRLPSELEWEYACRSGTKSLYHFGDDLTTKIAHYKDKDEKIDSPRRTVEVTRFDVANAFGLYGMHGNICEWCIDIWDEGNSNLRVIRGGSWIDNKQTCSSIYRRPAYQKNRENHIGFRIVMDEN